MESLTKTKHLHLNVFVLLFTSLLTICAAQERIELSYTLEEETVSGHVIGDVVSGAHLYQLYTDDVLPSLEYFFLSQTAEFVRYFNVNQHSGVLSVAQPIDRDTICAGEESCVADLDIAIHPVAYFRQIKVFITITDVNDNAPRFDENTVIVPVPENSFEGSSFRLPGVVDVDSGVRGIQAFRLEPETDKFSLRVRDNLDGQRDLDLLVNSRLDRETAAYYRLHVFCWDGGSPQQTGTLTVDVQVTDSNDNKPTFTNATYMVTVSENVAIGTTLVRVTATDSDEGHNGRIEYSFGRNTQQAYGNIFDIDESTGDISTVSELDRDTAHTYSLSIEATDNGAVALSDFARVVIHVMDENDNAPQIDINTFSTSGQVEAPENAANGTFMARILVNDPDTGANGDIECTILSNLFGLVQVYEGEYQMVTTATFNREVVDAYEVVLECADHGDPPQVTRQTITVHITDDNDNTPVFESAQYNITLRENNPLDDFLLTVTATDADTGLNAAITYAVFPSEGPPSSSGQSLLTIDSQTGAIYADRVFDREERSYYRFTLMATDSGDPPRSSSAILNLNILDRNDEPPSFNITDYKFGTFENQPVGTEIGSVRATDRDLFPNNDVSYSFVDMPGIVNDFNIDSVTGLITTKKILDREHVAEYNLIVAASNPGYDLTSTVSVTIYVADKNDNAPHIVFPSPGNNTINITSSLSVGDTVTHILASDFDLGSNADLTFTIVEGNDDGYFDMNPILGEIFISKIMEIVTDNQVFVLKIMVSDKGSPSQYSTSDLRISISSSALVAPFTTQTNQQRTNLMIIVISCSLLACVLFVLFFLFVLFMMRRRKPNQPDIRGRANSSCMEATKALLTMKGSNPGPESERVHEQESIDSGVDTGDAVVRMADKAMAVWKQEQQTTCYGSSAHSPHHYDYPPETAVQLQERYEGQSLSPVQQMSEERVLREFDVRFHDSPHGSGAPNTCHMREIQLRVHEMLYQLNGNAAAHDTDSTNSDSGKGPSEEGDPHDSITGVSSFPMVVFNPKTPSPQPPELPPKNPHPNFQPSSPPSVIPPPQNHPFYSQPNKPILKKSPINALPPPTYSQPAKAIPDYCQTDGAQKKKTVHFVKPYTQSPQRYPIEPNRGKEPIYATKAKVSNNSDFRNKAKKKAHFGGANNTNTYPSHKQKQKDCVSQHQHGLNQVSQLPYGHPQLASQHLHSNPLLPVPYSYQSDDNDSMDGSDDGGSSTSGSYCMDVTPKQFTEMSVDNGTFSDHVLV